MAALHHTQTGSGAPALVFVHGFACARSDWDLQVTHFSPRHACVAVDLGGHGTTPGTEAHRRIETHGADVAELVKALQLTDAVLIGHSMGCRVAMEASARIGERARALVLVDGSRLGEAGSRSYEGRAKALAESGYATAARAAFGQMFSPDFDPSKRQAIIDRALSRPAEIAGPLFADIGRYDSQDYDRILASIRVPVLAIQSTETRPTGQRLPMRLGQTTPYLEMLRSRIGNLTVEIVPGIGHFPQLERPAETNAMIDRFVARLA